MDNLLPANTLLGSAALNVDPQSIDNSPD